jgi:hypothetical protein
MCRQLTTFINYQISIINYFRGFFRTINLSDLLVKIKVIIKTPFSRLHQTQNFLQLSGVKFIRYLHLIKIRLVI